MIIFDIALDQDGDFYMAANFGIYHFDGQHWDYFDKTNSDFPLLSARLIEVTQEGKIWVANSQSIAFYDGNQWKMYDYTNSPLSGEVIGHITIDSHGDLWVAQVDEQLFKIDQSGNWSNWNASNAPFPIGDWWNHLHIDANDHLWISWGEEGMLKFDGQTWTTYLDDMPFEGEFISAIHSDHTGQFYVKGDHLYIWDGQEEWIQFNETNSILPDYFWTYEMATDNNDNLWLATNSGLYQYHEEGLTTENEEIFNTTENGLDIKAFPNPVVDELQLSWNNQADKQAPVVQIIDAKGLIISEYEATTGDTQLTISVEGLPAGIYWVQLSSGAQKGIISFLRL